MPFFVLNLEKIRSLSGNNSFILFQCLANGAFLEVKTALLRMHNTGSLNRADYPAASELARKVGEFDLAIDWQKRVLENSPRDINQILRLHMMLLSAGRPRDSLSHLKSYAADEDMQADIGFEIGNVYLYLKMYDEGLEQYISLLDRIVTPKILQNMALVYLKQGKFDLALSAFGGRLFTQRLNARILHMTTALNLTKNRVAMLFCMSQIPRLSAQAHQSLLAMLNARQDWVQASALTNALTLEGSEEFDGSFCTSPELHIKPLQLPEAWLENLVEAEASTEFMQKNWAPHDVGTRFGYQTVPVRLLGENYALIRDGLMRAVMEYLESQSKTWPTAGEILGELNNYCLVGWITSLHNGGHQSPHIHKSAVVSGVVHLADAAQEDAGRLVFSGQPAQLDVVNRHVYSTHVPKRLQGFIFPSCVTHYTEPYVGSETRRSFAFDLVKR